MKLNYAYLILKKFSLLVLLVSYGNLTHTSLSSESPFPPGATRYTDSIDPTIDPVFLDNDYMDTLPSFAELGLRAPALDPDQVVMFLINLGILDFIEEGLYCRTNGLNIRSLLDSPLFEPRQCCYPENWTVAGSLFWNQVNRSNLTPKETALKNYLNIFNPSFLDKVNSRISLLGNVAFDVAELARLFENMSVQQRRFGIMMTGMKRWRCFEFRILTPCYYLERNYYFSVKEQDNAREFIADKFGAGDAKTEEQFQNDHLISDRLGIGDTRIEFDAQVFNRNSATIRLGFLSTIPTAFSFKKGLKGTNFKRLCQYPTVDFNAIYAITTPDPTQEQKDAATNEIRQIALGALDQLSANLLDAPLGNGGHFGLGFLLRAHTPLSNIFTSGCIDNWSWNNRFSAEYQLPAKEPVFYIKNPPLAEIAARDFQDDSQAQNNLNFLQDAVISTLYPLAHTTTVKPGVILRWTNSFCYDTPCFNGRLGSDFYLRTKPGYANIKAPCDQLATLNIPAAHRFLAFQAKITGGISGIVERPEHTWFISFDGDYTCFNTGLGKDFTMVFSLEANF
jgi:hypothetical protein